MTDLKLCKDCKHYKKDWGARITGYGDTFDLCLHPLVTENVVTGRDNGRYCVFYTRCNLQKSRYHPWSRQCVPTRNNCGRVSALAQSQKKWCSAQLKIYGLLFRYGAWSNVPMRCPQLCLSKRKNHCARISHDRTAGCWGACGFWARTRGGAGKI